MTTQPNLKTIRDYIRYATSQFNEAGLYFGHGTDNAWDEAITLVLRALHLPHDINPSVIDANLTDKECALLSALIDKRVKKRIPVPYLIHEAFFANLSFYVDERVIIPRSAIAELIENQFQPWVDIDNVTRILDLCTGSACIAIACAKYFPHADVDACDISKEALAVAKINTLRHEVTDQVHLIESDLFSALQNKKYDIIVSNPPYVSSADMETLPAEYQHEPKISLAAGSLGLDVVIKILREAPQHLTPNGILIVEVGNSETTLAEYYPHIPFTWLQFERGDGGVFMLTAKQLSACQHQLQV